ncbi:WD repeat domain-containing protein 83 [Madurella mycetomatis]|uniref:WD repeat domain-containing protein 83 n=1 Tax=Madurella mycetomatis TaxID=100816 RepID=A0A175W5W0_9PEZI|nr:WD repeat domain-containing protein 83 [Madurella mycetomatis]
MTQRGTAFPTRPVAQLLGSNGPIHAVAYSASPGTYILTGSDDRSIRLYNPSPASTSSISISNSITSKPASSSSSSPGATPPPPPAGRLIQTYAGHAYAVLSVSVSSSNAHFASAGGDRAVLLWDVSTAQTIRRFGSASTAASHTGRVNCVAFAGADDALVVSGGLDCTVRIWDARSGSNRAVQVLADARDAVTCLGVTAGAAAAEVLAGSVDGRVRAYDVRMGRCVTDVFPASVTSLCLARDGRTALVGTLDSKLRLMDRANGSCLRTYEDAGWRNEELRVQSVLGGRERWVVVGDEMTGAGAGTGGGGGNVGRVWAWDLLTGKLVATVSVPWGGNGGDDVRKKVVDRDGKEKERKNVVSCIAWKDGGFGDQFCVGGTSGVVTVFGQG